jgi:peroxiredoxin
MGGWRRIAVAVMVVAGLGLRPAIGQQDVHATLIAAAERKPAAAFELPGADGKTMQMGDFKGKVVLLNFWATACGGCKMEIPAFVQMQTTYGEQGFTAVGISLDMFYEGNIAADAAWAKVKPFEASHGMNYPVLMGDAESMGAYGVKALPVTYLLDKQGRVAAMYVGVVNKDDVEANVKKLLAES